MAISAVMFFKFGGDVRKIYDAVIDEMGVRDNAPQGAIYHWSAPVPGGIQVCDMWETQKQFETFADEKIGPITAKHGLAAPQLEITPVHEFIKGRITSHKGTGLLIDFEGDTNDLLRKIDEANARMNVPADPPDGLVIHWTTPSRNGIRVVDHWRSHDDFERFMQGRLGETLSAISMPQPRIKQFDVYNTIDPRVTAEV